MIISTAKNGTSIEDLIKMYRNNQFENLFKSSGEFS